MNAPPLLEAWFSAAELSGLAVMAVAALIGGLVRGFTGFGFAMVFMPIASMVAPPAMALGILTVIDAPFSFPLAAPAIRRGRWAAVLPVIAGTAICLPFASYLMLHLDPLTIRWIISLLIAAGVALLATGWRYSGELSHLQALLTGGAAGIAVGMTGLAGPVLALFWLASRTNGMQQTRDNIMLYFALSTIVTGVVFAFNGVLSIDSLRFGLPLMLPYGIGVLIGAQTVRFATEPAFRRAAYAVIMIGAGLSLPWMDGLFGR